MAFCTPLVFREIPCEKKKRGDDIFDVRVRTSGYLAVDYELGNNYRKRSVLLRLNSIQVTLGNRKHTVELR